MPSEIIDLDKAVPAPKRVKLDGVEYLLPGDIPAELYLTVKERENSTDDTDLVESISEQVLDLFRVFQPEFELPSTISISQLFSIIPMVYYGAEPNPTKPPTSGRRGSAKPTSSRKTPKARQSRS